MSLKDIKTPFQYFVLSVLFLYGDIWAFYDQVQRVYWFSLGRTAK